MEPVSLTLGLLPLVGGALKMGTIAHKKFKLFRHYSREIRRIHKQLDRQQHFFTNEIHLLLAALNEDDEDTVEDMLKNLKHPIWNSEDLEAGVRKALGKNYQTLRGIIEDIRATMEILFEEVECFDLLMEERRQDESFKDVLRRLRGRVKISCDETKMQKHIQDLRTSNDDLKRLREQAHELSKPAVTQSRGKQLQQPLDQEFGHFRKVRVASRALHDALTAAWAKSSAFGTEDKLLHTVRLFLDARVKEDVHMDVVISCLGHGLINENATQERLARFMVRSQVRDWVESGLCTPPDSTKSGCFGEDRRKRRKVRFSGAEQGPSETGTTPGSSNNDITEDISSSPANLCSKDLCSALHGFCEVKAGSQKDTPCLGYIEGRCQETFRHSFYRDFFVFGGKQKSTVESLAHPLISMNDVLSQPAETTLSVVDQLKLARNLVSAVLKFHSTPWLRELFTLYDLSFYQRTHDLPGSLQTLHVVLDFIQEPPDRLPSSMEGLEPTSEMALEPKEMETVVELAKLQYGIRNLTLWSLGTTLLQIGRWSKVESTDDVSSVRKLAGQVSSLGPKYRDLTKKCLECDFGYGDDLSKPRLQQAVYEGVVCELSKMIKGLDVVDETESD